MSKKHKCQIPVLSHVEYMAVCKRASRDGEPYPAREFEADHKLTGYSDYLDICSACGMVVFKGEKEMRKIRTKLNKEMEGQA